MTNALRAGFYLLAVIGAYQALRRDSDEDQLRARATPATQNPIPAAAHPPIQRGVSLFPSTYSVFALNQISNDLTTAEREFQATHLDGGVSGDAPGLVSVRAGFHDDKYELMETIIQGGADDTGLSSYCAAHGLSVEDAFLHYSDDSDVYGKDSHGAEHHFRIPGWGLGKATSRIQARVQTFVWTQPRWVLNHASSCVKAYVVSRAVADVRGGDYRGNMIDEMGPECGSTSEDVTGLPRTISGGLITEYGNVTRETLIVPCPNRYETDVIALFNYVQTTVAAMYPNFTIWGNIGAYINESTIRLCEAGAGCGTENVDYETSSGQSSEAALYSMAKIVAGATKLFVWSEMHGADTDPTGDLGGKRDYNGCNYPTKTGPHGRHSMWSLSNYWIARQGNLTRFAQAPAKAPNGWTTPLSKIWYAAIATDLGAPQQAAYYVWMNGTDAAGQKFKVYRRDYANAIVLSRSRNGWNPADWGTFSVPTQMFNLGGTYKVLYSDGTLGPPVTQIGLCLAEAITLVKGS